MSWHRTDFCRRGIRGQPLALEEGYNSELQTGGNLDLAQRHLAQIPGRSREARAAATIRREIMARQRRQQRIEDELAGDQRGRYARTLDQQWVRDGLEVQVSATGNHKTTLHIEYIFCGRVFMDQAAAWDTWRQLGFTRVICSDGFTQRTTWDL